MSRSREDALNYCCNAGDSAMEPSMRASLTPIVLAQEADFHLGGLLISPSQRLVGPSPSHQATSERLQPRIMQVLIALAHRRGEVVSRDEMMAVCWGGFAVSDDAINRCIARIRRLSETHGGFTLETIARVGYQLNETGVSEQAPDSAPPLLSEASMAALLSPDLVTEAEYAIALTAPAAAPPSWVATHGTVAATAFAAGVLFTATLFVGVHFLL
ncbi:MAG: winged helix-turn-helix domain-containing protein [Rhizomicrobium sp.]|nr:winged helix-turn-helix domain-containing protein [Rhizomicrobium sp.]